LLGALNHESVVNVLPFTSTDVLPGGEGEGVGDGAGDGAGDVQVASFHVSLFA
jgi:hypothetical protein